MMVSLALVLLGALAAVVAPRLLARTDWREREPVVALWVWQCVVAAVLLSFALSMVFSAAATWASVRGQVFASAPQGVVRAYALDGHRTWSAALAIVLASGGLWTAAMLTREIHRSRSRRRQRRGELLVRSPVLAGGGPRGGPPGGRGGGPPPAGGGGGAAPPPGDPPAARRRRQA
ncbi:M56 family peptidase, partial [Streptomyces sp. 8L]|nr:M56 family peptidase [Streptomyces sp. 8L]